MSIYITGDTHGDQGRFLQFDATINNGDYLIICGDWGYIFRNNNSETVFLDDLETRPYTILFIDGNYENFPAIYEYPKEVWNGGKIHRIRKNIIRLSRGQVFEIEGYKFFVFGGGYSIDKAIRMPNVSWWKEELPELPEFEEGKKNLELHNWKVDYMITHTLNVESIKVLAALNKYNEIKPLYTDEAPLNFYLEEIRELTTYKEWFFGHFHIDKKIEYTNQNAVWLELFRIDS